ncbi:uncharacterized protein METZ01_LOCUS232424, partial [marine metagenome]
MSEVFTIPSTIHHAQLEFGRFICHMLLVQT